MTTTRFRYRRLVESQSTTSATAASPTEDGVAVITLSRSITAAIIIKVVSIGFVIAAIVVASIVVPTMQLGIGGGSSSSDSSSDSSNIHKGNDHKEHQQSSPSQHHHHPGRPNILLLLTDDQDLLLGGTSHMTFYNQHLVEQGTTFENFFVHTPVCCPSRSSILTGRYIHNGGALNNSYKGNCGGSPWRKRNEHFTIGVYGQQAGYQTGFSGKYLNTYAIGGSTRVPPGWNKWLGLAGNSVYYNYKVIRSDDGSGWGTKVQHGDDYNTDYFSDVVANRTLDMIREFTTSTTTTDDSTPPPPFLIVNSWPAPHGPFTPAPWAANLFPGTTAPRTPNWNASDVYQQQKHWIVRQQSPLTTVLADRMDEVHQLRLETLQSVDRHIDQFIQLLQEQKVLDNTIIIYTSDNGFNLGQHRISGDKRHLYEHDIRVPFVVRGPNIPKNTVVSDMALNIDIAPTIYQLMQNTTSVDSTSTSSTSSSSTSLSTAPIPDTMDGISFLPIVPDTVVNKTLKRTDFLITYHGEGAYPCGLIGCPSPPPNAFYTIDSYNNTYHCLRSIISANQTDFTYCEFQDNENFVEYYDNFQDPWQLNNQAFNLSGTRRTELSQRLAVLQSCKGITCRQ